MNDAVDRAPTYLLAFEEAGRGLDSQERSVNELRSRGGVLMATATVATSFFGPRVISGSHAGPWAWVAMATFAGIGLSVLAVLWPREDWSFNASAADMIADYVEPHPLEIELVHRDLALHRSASYDQNATQLGKLFFVFRLGLVALVVEVAAWLIALASHD